MLYRPLSSIALALLAIFDWQACNLVKFLFIGSQFVSGFSVVDML